MSAANEALAALPARQERPRHLWPAAQGRRRRPRLAYAVIAVAGALAILAAQMGLSIAATEASFRVSELTAQQRELTWQKQELYDQVAGLSSPQYLAANAASLGMVINQSPTYLRLSDGKIIGSKKAAGYQSSVNALGKSAVSNALVEDTPLITDPDATIAGAPEEAATETADTLPPPITDGLPTPNTR
ncbi:MAG: hypothetical protein QM611_02435 [Microbacterium sp.]|uniref:hypothetical protein n=1 Tax=Microbacterium sp. TaxID=51671 RepID=UPI0039E4C745